MKTFAQLLEAPEKTVVMAFGRMNPPTVGHAKLVDKVHEVANELHADHSVRLSHSQDSKKNPLTGEQKVMHARRFFPKTNISSSTKESPSYLSHAAELHKKGYQHLVMVAGEDRASEYEKTLKQYNGKFDAKGNGYNFKSIKVVSAGHRDPNASGVEGMSASKMRQHAAMGDEAAFKKGIPSHVAPEHAHELYTQVRQGMKMQEEKEREGYINGTTFLKGDLIEDLVTGQVCPIEFRGDNYVTIVSESGAIEKRFIKDITMAEKDLNEITITDHLYKQKAAENRKRMAAEKAGKVTFKQMLAQQVKNREQANTPNHGRMAVDIEHAFGNSFPDSDPYEHLAMKYPHLHSAGTLTKHLNIAARKHLGAKSFNHYIKNGWDDYDRDNKNNPDSMTKGQRNPWGESVETEEILQSLEEAKAPPQLQLDADALRKSFHKWDKKINREKPGAEKHAVAIAKNGEGFTLKHYRSGKVRHEWEYDAKGKRVNHNFMEEAEHEFFTDLVEAPVGKVTDDYSEWHQHHLKLGHKISANSSSDNAVITAKHPKTGKLMGKWRHYPRGINNDYDSAHYAGVTYEEVEMMEGLVRAAYKIIQQGDANKRSPNVKAKYTQAAAHILTSRIHDLEGYTKGDGKSIKAYVVHALGRYGGDEGKQWATRLSEDKETEMKTLKDFVKGEPTSAPGTVQVLDEKAPPGMEDLVMRLKKQYPNQHEKAFATAWSIYNKKHGKNEEVDLENAYVEAEAMMEDYTFTDAEGIVYAFNEEMDLEEKHIGFAKLKSKLAHKKGVTNPGAVAAAIGRKKYGKKKFQAAAAAGHAVKEEVVSSTPQPVVTENTYDHLSAPAAPKPQFQVYEIDLNEQAKDVKIPISAMYRFEAAIDECASTEEVIELVKQLNGEIAPVNTFK